MKLELNKIYCMDCLEGLKQIDDNSIDLVLTDPPYNIMGFQNIKTTDTTIIRNVDWDKIPISIPHLMQNYEKILKDGGSFVIFCSDKQLGQYIDYCSTSQSLRYSNTLIWEDRMCHPSVRKRSFSNHAQYMAFGHKEVLSAQKESKYTFNWLGEKQMSNVMHFNGCTSFEYGKANNGKVGEWVGHPTQKPTKLLKHILKICSNEGDLILDPFMGSGTTAVACKQLQRNFIGFELSQKYVDIANKRLQQDTLFSYDVLQTECE